MATDITTTNLKVNVLGFEEFDEITSKATDELYVVKQDIEDTDNSIASRTYADVGRNNVVTSATAPTSPFTQIWIDTDQEVVYITPANADMDNITEVGQANIKEALTPNYNAATSISTTAGGTYNFTTAGWLFGYVGNSSNLSIKKDSSTGVRMMTLVSVAGQQMSDKVLIDANTTIYIDMRSGTTELVFYPCKGIVV